MFVTSEYVAFCDFLSGSYMQIEVKTWSGVDVGARSVTHSGIPQGTFLIPIYNSTTYTGLYAFGGLFFTDTNTYLHVVRPNASVSTFSATTGVTLNNNYPVRVIRSDLVYDASTGAFSGAVTVMSAPIETGACRIVNVYFSSGVSFTVQTVDVPNPQGAVGNGMGAVWCYKTTQNQYGVSFYKSLYSDKYKYTVTLGYNTNNQITSASASQVSDPNYPVMVAPTYIWETYTVTTATKFLDYYKEMYGWSQYLCGSVRVERTSYPALAMNAYTLTRTLVSGGEGGGGGTGGSATVTGYQTITNNTFYYFKLGFPSSSDIKIMSLGADINVTGVSQITPLSLYFRIYKENTLKYTYVYNITTNGTFRVTVNPETMVGNGNIRLGVIPVTYSTSTIVMLGYGAPNVETYYKDYVEPMDFTVEGQLWSYRGAFSYTYQDLGTGIGTGGAVTPQGGVTGGNGTYIYSYNGSSPWGSQTLPSVTTPMGSQIRNAFVTMGYGDIGGVVILVISCFGFLFGLARFGVSGSDGLVVALVMSTVLTFFMGLLDITVFAIVILAVIIIAGGRVFLR
jgi:hypothetical protein